MESKKTKGKKLNKKTNISDEQSKDITQILIGSLLLLIGMSIGVAMSIGNTFALDTSTSPNATTSNATNPNATAPNATNPNATSPNATTSNATNPNATTGNVYLDSSKIYIEKITTKAKEVKIGEKVEIELCTNVNILGAKLTFKSSKGNQFTVYLNNVNGDEYIEIPTTVTADTYYLSQLTMQSVTTETTYVNGNDYDFKIELKITEKESPKQVYNNEDITEKTIKEIASTETKKDDKSDVTINATGNTVISKEVFNSIKGTDKNLIIKYQDNEIIFNGKDITEPKDIDVKLETACITDDEDFKKIDNNGYIVNFANNGDLPGKEIVKIKATTEMKEYFGNKKLYVYYYDKENNKFTLIAKNVSLENDYYQFVIDHNSKYLLTDKKIETKDVEVDENVVDFQNSNKTNITIILLSILLIIAVIIFVLLMKGKNNLKKKKD